MVQVQEYGLQQQVQELEREGIRMVEKQILFLK